MSTTSTGRPVRRRAVLPGSATVADASRITGVGPVPRAHPPQPPQHLGHVAAEHPAVVVALVDHDVAQPAQERRPARVLRQQGVGEHVRIGVHVARVRPGPVPVLPRGVPVEGCGPHPGKGEAPDGRQLIPRQRLGRREVERARRRLLQQAAEQRQQVAERLPGRGTGREHHVTAGPSRLRRRDLVQPRPLRPRRREAGRAAAAAPTPASPPAGPAGRAPLDVRDGLGPARIQQQAAQRGAGLGAGVGARRCGHDHEV